MSKQKKARKKFYNLEDKKVPINFRVLPKQKEVLQKRADTIFAGNLSKCINNKLFSNSNNTKSYDNKESFDLDKPELYALIRELNKIGNNLNQLTRRANMGHFVNDKLEKQLPELLQKKEEIFAFLIKMLTQNNKK